MLDDPLSLQEPALRPTSLQRYARSWSTSRHGADIVNVGLHPRHAPLVGSGPRSRSGSLAMLAAIRRASSRGKVAKPGEIVAPDRSISRGQGPLKGRSGAAAQPPKHIA
jgi:hypothetical protein